MKNRVLYEICKLQDIIKLYEKYKEDTRIYCPYCNKRKAKVIGDKWESKCCHKKGSALELLRLVEEDYCEKHGEAYWDSKTNQGVDL